MKKVITIRSPEQAGKVFGEMFKLMNETELVEMVYRYRAKPRIT